MINKYRNNYDLGEDSLIGDTEGVVSHSLTNQSVSSYPTCLICANTAQYRLVPKSPQYNTIEVEERGYVCGYCVTQQRINPNQYGLRELPTG